MRKQTCANVTVARNRWKAVAIAVTGNEVVLLHEALLDTFEDVDVSRVHEKAAFFGHLPATI